MKLTQTDLRSVAHHAFHLPENAAGWSASGVSTDSRAVEAGQLFVALRGERFDGHRFIPEVLARGVAGVVVDVQGAAAVPPGTPALVVENTFAALGQLAAVYRRKFEKPVIAVGGSNGKTTTKDMISRVLATRYSVLSTEGNNNNHVGVPLTLFKLAKSHDMAVVEVGTNHPGEIAALRDIVQPTHALLTNIGREHLEFFGDVEGVAKEETALWESVASKNSLTAFVNADDPVLARSAKAVRKRVRYGFRSRGVNVRGSRIQLQPNAAVSFRFAGGAMKTAMEVQLQVPGLHSAVNALAAAAVGLSFRVKPGLVREALQAFTASSKRMEVENNGGVIILNDTYNANPDSSIAALETLAAYPATGKRIAVLADMLELGNAGAAEHERVGEKVGALKLDYLLTYGTLGRIIARASGLRTAVSYDQKNILAEYLLELVAPGDVVLIKGSRGMKMEDVVLFLRERLGTGVSAAGSTKH